MDILVIFTGGTIGSIVSGEHISVNKEDKYRLISLYKEKYNSNNIHFHTISPYTILSENLNGDSMRLLGETVINSLATNQYNGIIITHGSDTLQYSASMLDLLLPNPSVPIFLVASNYVLDDPRANGMDNFAAAIDTITRVCEQRDSVENFLAENYNHVFVPYRNSNGIVKLHRGAYTLPHASFSDDLYSLDTNVVNYEDSCSLSINTNTLHLPDNNVSGILLLRTYPGMVYPTLKEDSSIRAILLDSYHSGTFNCSTKEAIEFFECAKDFNIPVYLNGLMPGPSYESTKIYHELNINILSPMSPITAYMLIWMSL